MKTKIALGAFALTIASFNVSADTKNPVAEQTGKKIFAALQHNAFTECNAMIPTLPQLLQVMDTHASFYGAYLSEAKSAMREQYSSDVKRIERSFSNILEQGKLDHIAWSKANFVSAERDNSNLVIEFTFDGQLHRVEVAVTDIDGQLYAGEFLSLF